MLMGWLVVWAGTSHAQGELDPDFLRSVPMLGKGGFSLMGTATPDAALPATISFNPAALAAAATFFQVKHGVEFDWGRYVFREGPNVNLNVQHFFFPVKRGLMRLSRYGVRSNSEEARVLPGVEGRLRDGEAYEISWGYLVCPTWHVGLALVPYDKVETVLKSDGVLLAHGEGKSNFEWRAGAHYQPNKKFGAGVVYAWEKDRSEITLLPALTGAPAPMQLSGRYRNIITLFGATYQPREGTVIFGNVEKYRLAGPAIDERLNILFYGITQFLTKDGSYVSIGSLQRGFFISGSYTYGKWIIGFSYSPRSNRRLEEFLGRSKGGLVWVGYNY
jgi:hypothetical protein